MQDNEMYKLFSSLDLITPPAGVSERLLDERILKKDKEKTPVNEADSNDFIFSVIEDKRSDILAPVIGHEIPDMIAPLTENKRSDTAAPVTEEKTETTPSAGEAEETAEQAETTAPAIKRSRPFAWLGAAAACLAVIVMGMYVSGLFGKGKPDTAASLIDIPIEEEEEPKVKIEDEDTMFELLGNDSSESRQAYRLADHGYLLCDSENNTIIRLDQNKEETARSDNITFEGKEFITSSDKKAFFRDTAQSSSKNILRIYMLDLQTLQFVIDDKSIMTIDPGEYHNGAELTSYKIVWNDTAANTGAVSDDLDTISIYFTLSYTADDGTPASTLFRRSAKDANGKEMYTVTNKPGADKVSRIEAVYSGEMLADGYDLYVVTSQTPAAEDDKAGYVNKCYFVTIIDPTGKCENATDKLFDETDTTSQPTFAKNHTVICRQYGEEMLIINKNTGIVAGVGDFMHYENQQSKMIVELSTDLIPSDTREDIAFSRYSAALVSWNTKAKEIYDMVDGYPSINTVQDELCRVLEARTDYAADGRVLETVIVSTQLEETVYGGGMTYFDIIEGKAINLESGSTVTEPDLTDQNQFAVHTPEKRIKLQMHGS